jgi:hypothetical protein
VQVRLPTAPTPWDSRPSARLPSSRRSNSPEEWASPRPPAAAWNSPHDLLLSTLNSYLQAIGGTARMIVSFADGHETTLYLSELA